jgi:hypothetical protein
MNRTLFSLLLPLIITAAQAQPDSLGRQGPEVNKGHDIQPFITSDYEFKDYFDILNINRQIFEDQNPKSGYFYYYPREYQLSWEPMGSDQTKGYNFKLVYLSADGTGKSKVMLTLKLEPNVYKGDIEIAKLLLKNALQVESDLLKSKPKNVVALAPIPTSEAAKISFVGLGGILDPKDVEVTVPTDLSEPVVLMMKTDRPDDLLTLLFNDNGLTGNMTIFPSGNVSNLVIPVTIKMDYNKTFGTAELNPGSWRSEGWLNQTPYTVILKNMHALCMEPLQDSKVVPKIYTWQMGNKELSEGSTVKFDASMVPVWIDNDKKVKKIWLEYSVKSCDDCNTEVRAAILDATSRSEMTLVTFDVLDVLSYTKATKMRLKVRSAQLDPEGKQKVEKNPPYTVNRDDITLESLELFVPKGQTPQFEYSVSLVLPDGDIKQSPWVSNKGKTEIGIGQKFIKEQFPGFVPAKN